MEGYMTNKSAAEQIKYLTNHTSGSYIHLQKPDILALNKAVESLIKEDMLVYCKNCTYYYKKGNLKNTNIGYCSFWDSYNIPPHGFCFWGKK